MPVTASHDLDRKSLRKVTGSTADFAELARDCVCFANGAGGQLMIGIEDDAIVPPANQRIESNAARPHPQRVGELTVNVQVLPELRQDDNGGQYILLTVPCPFGKRAGVVSAVVRARARDGGRRCGDF